MTRVADALARAIGAQPELPELIVELGTGCAVELDRQFAGEEKVSASLVKEFRGLVETYFAPPAQAEVKSSLADVMARRGIRVVS